MKCTEINRASAHRLSPGRLIASALKARERAVGPHSKFKVGAALLTRSGKIIGGTNVESASSGLTCCAERVALFTALTESERDFLAVASWPELDSSSKFHSAARPSSAPVRFFARFSRICSAVRATFHTRTSSICP